MTREPWHLRAPGRQRGRSRSRRVLFFGAVVLAAGVIGFEWWRQSGRSFEQPQPTLSAAPSDQLLDALAPEALPFARAITRAIEQRGRITVTLHVALADHRSSGVPAKFGDGDDPTTNFYWGALFGVETHLANAAGWHRAYADDGDGRRIIRRVVFRRRAGLTPTWQARGATRPFDVYLLACAWPSSQTVAAMEQPLRDALSDEPVVLTVDGIDVEFGAGSVMTGYVGLNRMLDHYWDPFPGIGTQPRGRQMGVFYVCSMSAVCLHQSVVDHGLYSVLFTRRPIVAEAYIVEGILNALLAGDLDDGFLAAAAERYARYQKGSSAAQAMSVFYR